MRFQDFSAVGSSSDANAGSRHFSHSPSPIVKQKGGSDRKALIAAATDLFSRFGVKATTLREVAVAAGCPQSAIRREFGGKAELLESVLRSPGMSTRPRFLRGSPHNTLSQEICQLVAWEVSRMRGHREILDDTWSQDSADQALTRVAGNLSFSSAQVIAERLSRHRNISDAERQFLLYAIQAVGFALGFVRPEVADAPRSRSRIKQLACMLADSIERPGALPNLPEFLLHSLLPV